MGLIKRTGYFALTVIIFLVITKKAIGQQDPLYTQYMDNLLVVNPGVAGSVDGGNLLLVSRNQWVSFPGAPVTRSISFNTPAGEKVGLGVSVMFDKIGPQKQTGVYFDYSYFLKVGENFKLGMGLKAGVSFYRAALTDLVTIDSDPIYSRDIYKNFLPNLGVGLYLFSDNTYFGISVPKLIKNTISREGYETEYVNKEESHIYAVAGTKFNLGPDFQLKTYGMLRYVHNSPFSIQTTVMVGFKEKFWFGGMSRFGDASGVVAQFQASEKILIGYSYDITTSVLNVFSNGTHEIMFRYNFGFVKK